MHSPQYFTEIPGLVTFSLANAVMLPPGLSRLHPMWANAGGEVGIIFR